MKHPRPVDVTGPLGAVRACPECGSERLRPVVDDTTVNFFCDDCARCWHVELGHVRRVNPATCAGCENYERCAPVYDEDHRT